MVLISLLPDPIISPFSLCTFHIFSFDENFTLRNCKLSEIPFGKEYIIQEILDIELAQKLLEMGCTRGEKITLERKAPFSDPIAIFVSNFMLSIRKEDAKQIIVKQV